MRRKGGNNAVKPSSVLVNFAADRKTAAALLAFYFKPRAWGGEGLLSTFCFALSLGWGVFGCPLLCFPRLVYVEM